MATIHMSEELRNEFQCSICVSTLRRPVLQCRDGHNFCGACIDDLVASVAVNAPNGGAAKIKISCPQCRCAMTKDEMSRNRAVERTLETMKMRCENAPRCTSTLSMIDYTEHLERCPHRAVQCSQHARGCTWRGTHEESLAHRCVYTLTALNFEFMRETSAKAEKRLAQQEQRISDLKKTLRIAYTALSTFDASIRRYGSLDTQRFYAKLDAVVFERENDRHLFVRVEMFKRRWAIGIEMLASSAPAYGLYMRMLPPHDAPVSVHAVITLSRYVALTESFDPVSESETLVHVYTQLAPVGAIQRIVSNAEAAADVARASRGHVTLAIECFNLSEAHNKAEGGGGAKKRRL
jgi:hypothetical protein